MKSTLSLLFSIALMVCYLVAAVMIGSLAFGLACLVVWILT